jgi:MtN3 and saliva related transmembrane protein
MTIWFFIGIIAAALTMVGFIPEIVRMYWAKSVADISLVTFLSFTLGVSLWAVYGVSVSDPDIIGVNRFSISTLVVALVLYFHNQRLHRTPGISRVEGGSPWSQHLGFLMVLPRITAGGGGFDDNARF